MRLIMMGTGPFALPTFDCLCDSPHQMVVLITRPVSPSPARRKAPSNPMREAAAARGVEILQPENVNTPAARRQLQMLRPDLLVVCDYGQILSAETLAVAPLGGINLHGSLLPKYRGAAPVQWAIVNGDRETGISVIHMTPRLDAGPCLRQRRVTIGEEETAAELEQRLARVGVEPVLAAIEELAQWDRESPLGTPQEASLSSRARRLKKSDGEVDWKKSATQIKNQVRGLTPWPGTFTHCPAESGQATRLILARVSVPIGENASGPPGTVVVGNRDHLLVATGEGLLSIEEIQPAGRRAMPISEFLRGHPMPPGTRLGTRV